MEATQYIFGDLNAFDLRKFNMSLFHLQKSMTLNSLLLEKLIPRYLVGIFLTYPLLLSIVNYSNFSFVKFNTLLFNPVCLLIMMSASSPEHSPGKAASHQMSVPMPSPQEAAMNATLSWYNRGKWEGQWRAVSSPSFWKLSQGYCSARLTLAGRVARQDFLAGKHYLCLLPVPVHWDFLPRVVWPF